MRTLCRRELSQRIRRQPLYSSLDLAALFPGQLLKLSPGVSNWILLGQLAKSDKVVEVQMPVLRCSDMLP